MVASGVASDPPLRDTSARARAARWRVAAEVLAELRREPGVTRAALAQRLGISSGLATEVTARLRDARLLSESDAPTTRRGRPTTALHAHPEGPLVLVVELRHEGWRCGVAALDGVVTPTAAGRHPAAAPAGRHPAATAPAPPHPATPPPDVVLPVVRRAVEEAAARHGTRIRAVSVSTPGVVVGTVLRQASGLGWVDVDLSTLVEGVPALVGVPLLVGNDATLAGVAEVRSGAAAGARVAVHVLVEAGPGGALVVDGRPVTGATGAAGEFGHMPFGDPAVRCGCGAWGCWTTAVGGGPLAAALGEPEPADPHHYALEVLARATTPGGDPRAAGAVAAGSAALGRGMAALVNALDPDVVTIGGVAIPLRVGAPEAFRAAYLGGLMAFRRAAPPPVRDAAHADDGAWLGAAAVGLDVVTSEEGLAAWVAR